MSKGSIDLDLIAKIHEVALGRADWEEVLADLRAELATETALLVVYGNSPEQTRRLSQTHGDGLPWDEYAQRFAAIDPYAQAMRQAGPEYEGLVVHGEDVIPGKILCATEYYNEWFRPHDLRYTAGAFVRTAPGRFLQLGMPRSARAGPYSRDELRRLQRYFNHIRRAVLIGEILGQGRAEPDYDRFARTHGLTPAEARLLESLVRTGSLKGSAALLHRSYYTLRAQLRAIFDKTGTHRQTELIGLVHGDGPIV